MPSITSRIQIAHQKRWLQLCVVNLRIVIGFAFLPAGLKKLLDQPFTDPDKVGVFHEFVRAFHATGPFYQFVGLLQLVAALLLMTQRFATLGDAIFLPVLVAITVLCWSTAGIPTIITVTLMTMGILALLLWDVQKWRGLFVDDRRSVTLQITAVAPVVDRRLWQMCGLAVFVTYLGVCALEGGIYRPRGAEFGNPSFYLLPAITLYPLVTWLVDRSRYRRRQSE